MKNLVKNSKMILLLSFFLLTPRLVFSETATPTKSEEQMSEKEKLEWRAGLWLKKGTEITVDRYDPKTRIFHVKINKEPDVGPNYTIAENLIKGIQFAGDTSDFSKRPSKVVGSIYQLQSNLRLLSETEVAARMKGKLK